MEIKIMARTSKAFRIGVITASLGFLLGMGGGASAATWEQRHPRRAEVNHRLANQSHRINRELREGEINPTQANALHKQDRFVRREERFSAAQHHGHITRAEQRALNQQENGISRNIGR
jgi:hypothetical protein